MAAENEGKCLDAVLRILEERYCAHRKILARDTPSSRGIELICEVGGQRLALEHTLIEPFPENQRDNIAFSKVLGDDLRTFVADLLQPGLVYSVYVDVYAFRNMKARQLESTRQQVISWLRATIPRLPPPTEYPQSSIRDQPPRSPVHIQLTCRRSKLPGPRFFTGRFAPADLEGLRRERLLKALKDKGPKLKAEREPGTRTVLVLENNDIALTNEVVVSETIEQLRSDAPYMPDEIYLVGTYTAGRFYVTQVREDGESCVAMGDDANPWEFDTATLAAV